MDREAKKNLSAQILLIGVKPETAEDWETKNLQEVDGFDVFRAEEKNPGEARAAESSLWELKVLLFSFSKKSYP